MTDISNIEFIHIPKTGGTTILTHLSSFDPVRFNIDRDHFTAQQLFAVDESFKNKYTFALHRNPFDRLISVWQYQVKRAIDNRDSSFSRYGEFNAWLNHFAGTLEWERNYFILPQWFWVSDWCDKLIITEMFAYKEFDKMLGQLELRLNTKFDRSIRLNISNKQFDYKKIASLESKKIMLELYKVDCEKFDYDW